MKLAGILRSSLVNGDGLRYVIFTTGCSHNCPECHGKELQDPDFGEDWDLSKILDQIHEDIDMIDGVTISGGDPFFKPNGLRLLLESIRSKFPTINIWTYTGYTYEYLYDNYKDILEKIDVLVDGRFEVDNMCTDKLYKGSNNQRIIRLVKGEFVEELEFK